MDSSGYIYVAGTTGSFGGGASDVILLKYNSSGIIQWKKTYGSTYGEMAEDLVVDGSYLYVVGSTLSDGQGGSDVLILKISASDGSVSWDRSYGTSDDEYGYGIDVDSSGNVYFSATQITSGGESSGIVGKYNSSGSLQWDKKYGSANQTDQAYRADVSGNYLYVAGNTTETDNDGDAYCIKIDFSSISPSIAWKKYLGNSSYGEAGMDVAVDSNGNVYVTGSYSGGTGTLTYKLNSGGTYQWHQVVAQSIGYGIETDGSNVFVTGIHKTEDYVNNVMFLKYVVSDGTLSWSEEWEGARFDSEGGYGVTLDGSDYAYITGYAPDAYRRWDSFNAVGALQKSDGDVPNWTLANASGTSSSIGRSTSTINGGTEDTGGGGLDVLLLKYDLT